ncbi:DUF6415 family natural product biosynthesis protein [Streptomyces blastmyceticus]|uniref:Uncharacterized protein n=1 Tax=Streptomyces blastmyceticus TaxID=68180 RepID=A0ABP3G6N1_9ACTN
MVPVFPGTAVTGRSLSLVRILEELIDKDDPKPTHVELRAWTAQLTIYLTGVIRVVREDALKLVLDDPVRDAALATTDEAGHRLRVGPGNGYVSAIAYAMSLASAVKSLQEHEKRLCEESSAQAPAHEAALDGRAHAGPC